MELRNRTVKGTNPRPMADKAHVWTPVERTPSEEELDASDPVDDDYVSANTSLDREEESDAGGGEDGDECDHDKESRCAAFLNGLKKLGASALRFACDVVARIPKKYVAAMCTILVAFIRQSCSGGGGASTEVDPEDLNNNGVNDTVEKETEEAVIDALAETVIDRV